MGLILQHHLQLVHGQTPDPRSQGRAQPSHLTRRSDGAQHPPQVLRLVALIDIGMVGQINAGQPHLPQSGLHGLGLHLGTHQHRHVAWVNVAMGVEQSRHLRCKTAGHALQMQGHGPLWFVAVGRVTQQPHGEGAYSLTLGVQQRHSLAAAVHLHKINLPQIGVKGLRGLAKHMVDGAYQGGRGAVVAVQAVQGLWIELQGGVTGFQVSAQVGASKAVDGLLGVANHDQGVVLANRAAVVNPVQAFVLPRVGVLKFVHQSHWVLAADGCCHLALVGVQGGVKALQQVLKIKGGLLLLGLVVKRAHLPCRMV